MRANALYSSVRPHAQPLYALQGARQIRAGAHGARTLFVFIAPPSMEELERRLRGRGTEAEEKVQRRLANAEAELAAAREPGFVDHVIVNDALDAAVAALQAAVSAHLPELRLAPSAAVAAAAPPPRSDAAGDMASDAAEQHACSGTSNPADSPAASDAPAGAAVKQYLRETVVSHVEAALLALAKARPADPLQFLIDRLVAAKAEQAA
jgi:Guanylate kinase/Dpy-30 motif